MVVTIVRDGRAGMPSQGGVDREVSTKVIVVVATGVELVAPTASVGAAIPAEAVPCRSRPQATAPNSAARCIGPIPSPSQTRRHRATSRALFLDPSTIACTTG